MSQPTGGKTISVSHSDSRSAVLAGFLGWTLDAFDYFLVVLCLPDIAKTFGVSDDKISLTLFLTLATRPIGALVFGLLADRYGRRLPLILNLIFYSTLSILSGFSPNYSTFLICRLLFGVGMGGEWGVGASLAMEHAPARLRGILSGLLQEGYAVGNLLASAAYFFLRPHVGWRPLFILGGIPALLALYIRFGVRESKVWQKSREPNWSRLGATLTSQWRLFIMIALLMWGMNLSSHGTQDMFPTFLKEHWNLGPRARAAINAVSAVGAIIGGLVVGMLSERTGRRRAIIGALFVAILIVPLWAYAPNLPLVIAAAFALQFMVQGAWGVIPAHITELSPDSVRGFLPGFAYQCGALLAGSIAWVQSLLTTKTSYANAMALTAAAVFLFAITMTALSKERRGVEFGAG